MKGRIFFVALAATAVLSGMWAGLVRIGWRLPPLPPTIHGPLMISGFLGTLISLERAAAFRWRWTVAAPLLSGLGSMAILFGLPAAISRGAILLGSLVLLVAFVIAYGRHFGWRLEWASATLIAGVVCWVAGNFVWVSNQALPRVSIWWVGFLLLTIAGERLELSRVQLLQRVSLVMFVACVGLLACGLLISLFRFSLGVQIAGAALVLIGLWLLRFDVARRTVRQTGLTRFIAVCLLPGYLWLVIAGGMWLMWGAYFAGGPFYDAMLHTVMLGFAFSMIFAHAPLIVPAVTGVQIPYHPRFYTHLVLLHASLILRVWGDLAALPSARAWGGMLNVIAILLFLGNTVWASQSHRVPALSGN